MDIALWIAQGLLAVAFLGAGSMKAFAFDTFAKQMDWASEWGRAKVGGIGASEIAGALGLVLPMLLGIATFLTPLAALCLAAVMVLAAMFHVRRGEMSSIGGNVVLFALAAFVAWGRWDLLAG
ncbi:MAG: DoxX family protein [Bacteroidota bacterium]